MSNKVKTSTPQSYYIPGDPSRTPVSHDDYLALMRDSWRLRKKLQRAGECNAPANHPCHCDCCGCQYRTKKCSVSLEELVNEGFEPIDMGDTAEQIIRKMIIDQIKIAFPKLDQIDRIVIEAKIIRQPAMTDRECAALIMKLTGVSISHQAVGKRLPKALERLRQLAGIDLDN